MVKQVKISNFDEVKSIMNAAARCHDDIGVHDSRGSIADAKSILGLMSLDYTKPVMLVSENERELESVLRALSLKRNHNRILEKKTADCARKKALSAVFFFSCCAEASKAKCKDYSCVSQASVGRPSGSCSGRCGPAEKWRRERTRITVPNAPACTSSAKIPA